MKHLNSMLKQKENLKSNDNIRKPNKLQDLDQCVSDIKLNVKIDKHDNNIESMQFDQYRTHEHLNTDYLDYDKSPDQNQILNESISKNYQEQNDQDCYKPIALEKYLRSIELRKSKRKILNNSYNFVNDNKRLGHSENKFSRNRMLVDKIINEEVRKNRQEKVAENQPIENSINYSDYNCLKTSVNDIRPVKNINEIRVIKPTKNYLKKYVIKDTAIMKQNQNYFSIQEEKNRKRKNTNLLKILKQSQRDGVRLLFEKCSSTQQDIVFPQQIEECEESSPSILTSSSLPLGVAAMYLKPPLESLQEGGLFLLTISFSMQHPRTPPTVLFRNPLQHPNVDFSSGAVAIPHEQLATLASIVEQVVALFYMPNLEPSMQLNEEAKDVQIKDVGKFTGLVSKQIKSTNSTYYDKVEQLDDLKDHIEEQVTRFRIENRFKQRQTGKFEMM